MILYDRRARHTSLPVRGMTRAPVVQDHRALPHPVAMRGGIGTGGYAGAPARPPARDRADALGGLGVERLLVVADGEPAVRRRGGLAVQGRDRSRIAGADRA